MVDFIIGFDFGHGETSVAKLNVNTVDESAAQLEAEDIYIIGDDREPKIPSIVGYDCNGNIQINLDVYQFKFLKVEAGFKAPMIASEKFPAIRSENKDYFRDFVVNVFEKLHEHPKNNELRNKSIIYFVACPSGWTTEQRDEYLKFFTDYCKLPIAGVIEESRAAYVVARRKLYDKNPELSRFGKKTAVLDLGSSTLDITMHSDRSYSDGFEIGACKIEEMLLQYFIETDEDFKEKYNRYSQMEESCSDQILFLLRKAKEEYFNRVRNGATNEIMLRCQIDWEELSSDEIPGISTLRIKGSNMEGLLESHGKEPKKYKDILCDDIKSFIKQHGTVDAIVLTGGASQMDFYQKMVMDCYGLDEDRCIVDRFPSYSISQGTAIMGYLDTKNPVKKGDEVPEGLLNLINRIPDLIKNAVIISSVNVYKTELNKIIDEWEQSSSNRTLKVLYDNFSTLLASWDEHYAEISMAVNQQVEESLSAEVSDSLSQLMRLYFGFNMQLEPIDLDYDISMTLPHEQTMMLLGDVYNNFKSLIDNRNILSQFRDPSSLNKDRGEDPEMLKYLSNGTRTFIDKWFEGVDIENEFDDVIKDCQNKVKDFYYKSIKYITCQI